MISHVPGMTNGDMQTLKHPDKDEKEGEELVPIETYVEIILTGTMNDHWLVAGTVADCTADQVVDIKNETLVLVAHGTDDEDNFAEWVNSTLSLAYQARLKLAYWSDPAIGLAGTEAAFIHHNETLHPEFTLRPIVENAEGPVVVPLIVSEGYFTGIPILDLLENLTCAYKGNALTPHPNVVGWIEMSAAKESTDLALQIYEEGELPDITPDDVAEAHGYVCLCVVAAFKVRQTAFKAWDRIPVGDNLEIITAHTSVKNKI